jgi:hypothetical protein
VSYNARAAKKYNVAGSLARFEIKNILVGKNVTSKSSSGLLTARCPSQTFAASTTEDSLTDSSWIENRGLFY